MLSVNFDALTRYLDRTAERGIPGCDLVVTLGHEVIYRHMSGERAPGKPMRGDEVYVLYSATKLFTMVAGMQLIERGAVRLDDPVSKYLPEYADLTVLDGGEVRMDGVPQEVLVRADELRALSLEVPFACRLSLELQAAGVPVSTCITDDALKEELCALRSKM